MKTSERINKTLFMSEKSLMNVLDSIVDDDTSTDFQKKRFIIKTVKVFMKSYLDSFKNIRKLEKSNCSEEMFDEFFKMTEKDAEIQLARIKEDLRRRQFLSAEKVDP